MFDDATTITKHLEIKNSKPPYTMIRRKCKCGKVEKADVLKHRGMCDKCAAAEKAQKGAAP